MTQQVVRTRISLPDGTTYEDTASLDLYWEATGSDTTLPMSEVIGAITAFFNNLVTGQVNTVAQYISPAITRATGGIVITSTDITAHLDGSPAGGPFETDTFTLNVAPSDAKALPPQVAIAMAYRADYGTDVEHGASTSLPSTDQAIDQGAPATHLGVSRPRARDRGRIFLGPLNNYAVGTLNPSPSGDPGQVWPTCANDLLQALLTLGETKNPGLVNQFNLVQWSRRNGLVKQIKDAFISAGLATLRKRIDTSLTRVHGWVPET